MTDETKKVRPEDGEVSEEDLKNVSGGGATHKDSWKGEAATTRRTAGGSGGEDL